MPRTLHLTDDEIVTINEFLASPRHPGEPISDYCLRMADRYGVRVFANTISHLVNLSLPPNIALEHWEDILRHQECMCAQTGHDVQLFTTILDYYTWLRPNLRTPVAIEAEALKRYRKMTILDHLTQLFNRRYFSATLEQECERATRIRQTLSLLMVDIDHFKRFNDTYGHAAGDCVLALVGKTIRNSARIMDQAVRYGGEEFAVMLPHTPRNDAYQVADRLRQTISSTPCHGPDGTNLGNITVSIGVASFPVDAQTPDGLVHAADRALYRAKGNGRNIVCNDTADLRREARYAVNLKAELLTNHGPNIANEGLILDISHCGAKCATSAPIQPKDELELRLSKELLTTPLPVQVRWVHPLSDQYSHIGLLFKATPPQLANFLTEQFKAREA